MSYLIDRLSTALAHVICWPVFWGVRCGDDGLADFGDIDSP